MIRKIIIGGIAAFVVLAGATPAFAVRNGELENTARSTVKQAESTVRTVEDDTTKNNSEADDDATEQRERIETRKAELLERLEQKQSERKEKLEGRRLALCENRQKNINSLIDRSVTTGRTHLANIQRVEARVAEFYAKKELSSIEYDAALDNADAAEAAAIASLDVMDDQDFDCQKVDGAQPSGFIQTSHQTKKEALNVYRQSVIELIKVTKEVFAATQSEVSDDQN